MTLRIVIPIMLFSILATGCSMREVKHNYDSARNWVLDTEPTAKPTHVEDTTPIIELNYAAADALDSDLWLKIDSQSPLYFQTFTNLSDPNDSAPFGRVVAEQVAARLAQVDRNVVDGEPRPDDYVTPVEEVRVLSPEALKARKEAVKGPMKGSMSGEDNATMADAGDTASGLDEVEIPAVDSAHPILPSRMTGTYLVGDDVVFVSARITTLRDRQLISSYQWTLPINQNTRMLLPQLLRPQRGMTPTVQTRF